MLLNYADFQLFHKLHRALLFFVNQRLQVIPDNVSSPDASTSLAPEACLKLQEALATHTDLIQQFVDENPFQLASDELAIVRSWRHVVYGDFYVFRQLKKYTLFLSVKDQPVVYGVVGLSQPIEELIGRRLPAQAKALLLPFKEMIVHDGLLASYPISFGPGIRRMLNATYNRVKAQYGIVESLPMSSEPPPPKPPKPIAAPKPPSTDEQNDALQAVLSLLERFCREHLNEEYAVLCRKLAEKLARKRPSPLLQGNPNAWASGIVRAVGSVNFLHDKSQTPYVRATDIDYYFGISPSSGAAKGAAIRKMFRMTPFDHRWTLPSHMDGPIIWTLEVDGWPVDIRRQPRHLQEIAFKKGLIPYIPADRPQSG